MKLLKKIVVTLLFPVLIFLAMWAICAANPKCYVDGKFIFLGVDLVRRVFLTACQSTCVALAIWLQLKNGRFDFSGGASMILTAIVAGSICQMTRSPWLMMVVAIVVGVVVSLGVAAVYAFGRLPIVIATIGVTLLYESMTYLIFGGNGVGTMYSDPALSIFGRAPMAIIPTAIAVATYIIYDQFTAAGRKGKVLKNNQSAGVNIGIDEMKNCFISYIYRGIIVGMAAVIYVSQNQVLPQSGLATSGIMFSYIVPVYMGMFIGLATRDYIGIIMAAIGMAILNYGLSCMNLGAGGMQQIIMGLFVFGFYSFSAQLGNITKLFAKLTKKQVAA